MDQSARETYILELDDTFLKGGVILSEWCSYMVRECDNSFAYGTFLATIITAMSAAETYLRAEYQDVGTLVALINQSNIPEDLKKDLHILRKFRNKWVHINEPWEDSLLIEKPEDYDQEIEKMAHLAVLTLRKLIYLNQFV